MTVEFLFLLSPNNSGTTVIGQYLQSQTGGYLPPFGNQEGQMAPAVRDMMRKAPWNPDEPFDWAFIRAEWEKLARAAGNPLFIECSPPNLIRTEGIRPAFDGIARYLVSISSPYSFIASNLFNYTGPPVRPETLTTMTEAWITRAGRLRAECQAHPDTPRINYEAFCADPTVVNRALDLPVIEDAVIRGKGNMPIGRIVDLTARNLAFLDFGEWDRVNAMLSDHTDLLDFFGYTLSPGEALIEHSAAFPAQFHAGIIRRSKWNARK